MFAITFALKLHDHWINDNGYGSVYALRSRKTSLKLPGNAWCDLLEHCDAELGIDSEFTRPGILALLTQVEEDVAASAHKRHCGCKFLWSPSVMCSGCDTDTDDEYANNDNDSNDEDEDEIDPDMT